MYTLLKHHHKLAEGAAGVAIAGMLKLAPQMQGQTWPLLSPRLPTNSFANPLLRVASWPLLSPRLPQSTSEGWLSCRCLSGQRLCAIVCGNNIGLEALAEVMRTRGEGASKL